MTDSTDYSRHYIALSALFTLGGIGLGMPSRNCGGFTFLGFTAAAACAAVICAASAFAMHLFRGKKINPRLFKALLAVLSLAAFYEGTETLIDFINLAGKILLPETHRFFIVLPFTAAAVYLSSRGEGVMFKFSVICFVFTVISVAIFFALSAKDFNTDLLKADGMPGKPELIAETKPWFFRLALPAALIPLIPSVFGVNARKRTAVYGSGLGLAAAALCLAEVLLLFGTGFAARLDFPLCAAVSTVTVGPLFTRMDGFVYCLYFAVSLIKTAVCAKLCFNAAKLQRKI